MTPADLTLISLCAGLAFLCARLWYSVRQARGDSNFWRKLYNAQTDYACRAEQRVAECERANQQLQHTVSELRRVPGRPDVTNPSGRFRRDA